MTNQPTEPQAESPAENNLPEEKLVKAGADMIDAEDNAYKGGDQDIDTAGTDADEESPTKALGAGIEVPKSTD
jgi:hypothetical protein